VFDYPNKTIITDPGTRDQREHAAAGLPQQFTTEQPFTFRRLGADPNKPPTSSRGVIVAAYMYGPDEASGVESFDAAAIARGDLRTLTHGFIDPAKPMAEQGLHPAGIATVDPIAEATAAAHRVIDSRPGGGTPGALR
jgi:hypothetical protein